MNDIIKFLVTVVLLIVIYMYIDTKNSSLIYVKSNIDHKMYLVRNVPDKQTAADLIATVRQKVEKLIIE